MGVLLSKNNPIYSSLNFPYVFSLILYEIETNFLTQIMNHTRIMNVSECIVDNNIGSIFGECSDELRTCIAGSIAK